MSRPAAGSLEAVARVRRVREQDSLTGLQQALREVGDAHARVQSLGARLDAVPGAGIATLDGFVALRTGLLAVEQAMTTAQAAVESATNLATSALEHWQRDKSRLKAIEMLQERRAAEARAEAARAEARELDDIATQLWQRRHRLEVVA
jgi:flagellar export protein FliJ